MSVVRVLFHESDNLLELDGLQDALTLAFINNATVTARVLDRAGTEVTGQTWPLTLGYVAASDGDYRGNLSDTLALDKGQVVTVEIIADGGAGLKRKFEIEARVGVQETQ